MTRTLSAKWAAALLTALTALAVTAALFPSGSASAQQPGEDEDPTPDAVEITRFAGTQRFETARLIAEATFEEAPAAVVARAEDWPDALAGSYLAGLFDAPVLLVSQDAVQTDTLTALAGLQVEDVWLLGGPGAISEANAEALEDAGYSVERVAGASRFETAAEVATAVVDDAGAFVVGEWDGERTAIVATGQQFADALVAGAAAWSANFPLLLTPGTSLHPAADAALDDLEIDRVILLGGTGAVSAAVEEAIDDKGIAVTRVAGEAGSGRWGTAVAFAELAVDDLGFSSETVSVATGFDFPDALAMGPRTGYLGSPLLLTPGTEDAPTATVHEHLRATGCESLFVDIAGGTGVVSEANEDAIAAAANDCTEDGGGSAG